MSDLVIRELGTRKEIRRIPVGWQSAHNLQKIMCGLLHNLNERYFVDDSECSHLYKQERAADV